MSRSRWREALLAYAFLLPSLAIFAVFAFYPLVRTVWLGRYRGTAFGNRRLIGWQQYADVFRSAEFQHALKVTVALALLTVPAGLVLGIGLAVLADTQVRGIGAFRTIFSSTVATSVAVASLMWLVLFQPSVGVLANTLGFDVLKNPGLLNNSHWALYAVSVTSIWANLGFSFIVVTAALQGVPMELYESAALDGASPWRRFTDVTLPMLGPTLVFLTIVLTVRAFQTYGELDLLTSGGPGETTTTLTYLIYGRASVINGNEGLQAASAVLLFIVLLVLSLMQFRGIEKRVTYER